MIDTATDEQCQHFAEQGYVVVRNAIDPEAIQSAINAIDNILDRALANEFGDQFPWIDPEQRAPAFLSDLYAPEKYDPAFGALLNSVMLPFAESLLRKPVRCSWLLLLTGGASNPYSVSLHRDNCEMGSSNEAELIELFNMNQCYFQAPLLPDDRFLQIVPGSHLRLPTEQETVVAKSLEGSQDIPGLITLELQPGDVVYRQTNTMHQGWNPEGLRRWTFVSGFWAADLPTQKIEYQDYPLVNHPEFIERLPPHCQTATKRFLQTYESSEQTPSDLGDLHSHMAPET